MRSVCAIAVFWLFTFFAAAQVTPIDSFSPVPLNFRSTAMTSHHNDCPSSSSSSSIAAAASATQHPFCDLPGDPSLILTTNVDLGAKKMDIMKAISKAIAKSTGKPESYVAVAIHDKADVIFGGSDAPTALGCLYSIGAIAKDSNGAIQKSVTDLLEDFGVDEARIYINFFDVPRVNVGWSRATFAG